MKPTSYFKPSQVFMHWLSVILVLAVIFFAVFRGAFGNVGTSMMLHFSFGIIVFIATVIRLALRFKFSAPDNLPKDEKLIRFAAHSIQYLLYFLLLALPITAFLFMARPIPFFDFFSIPVLNISDSVRHFMHQSHKAMGGLLIACIGLHGIAALFHHYIKKDNVLRSMWFAKKS